MDFVVRTRLGAFEPNADVFIDESAGRAVVTVELAGADPELLRIGVDERYLVITGRRRERPGLQRGSFAQKEIPCGDFVKRIALPVPIEYERVAASYDDGVLIIVAPIAATAYRPTARTELHILVKRTHS